MNPTDNTAWSARQWITLAAVCLACGLLPASLTGTSIALPAIASSLHSSLSGTQWVVNAYNLTFAGVMLACGALADLFGRKRLFAIGLTSFGLLTAGSALVTNIMVLDVLRGAAGVGAAVVLTSGSAILANTFGGATQMRAFGFLGSSFGCGLAVGPPTSGLLVHAFGWQSVFLLHGLIALSVLLALPAITESRDPDAKGVDWAGTVTFSTALFAIALVFVQGPNSGWTSIPVLLLLALAVAMLVGFVVVERAQPRPMFDLGLFRNPRFVGICAMPVILAFGFVALLVYLPAYFTGAMGRSISSAGLIMMLLTVPVLVFPTVSGAMSRRVPTVVLLVVSLLLIGGGAALLTLTNSDATVLQLAGPMLLIGTGVGISFGLLDGVAISSVEPARAGMAAGMFNTMRLTGEAMAIAGMGAVLLSLVRTRLEPAVAANPSAGEVGRLAGSVTQGDIVNATSSMSPTDRADLLHDAATAFTSSMHIALWGLSAICVLGAVAVGYLFREPKAASTTNEETRDTAVIA